jgi:hypothetical protein
MLPNRVPDVWIAGGSTQSIASFLHLIAYAIHN